MREKPNETLLKCLRYLWHHYNSERNLQAGIIREAKEQTSFKYSPTAMDLEDIKEAEKQIKIIDKKIEFTKLETRRIKQGEINRQSELRMRDMEIGIQYNMEKLKMSSSKEEQNNYTSELEYLQKRLTRLKAAHYKTTGKVRGLPLITRFEIKNYEDNLIKKQNPKP